MNTDVIIAAGLLIGLPILIALLYLLVLSPAAQESRALRRQAMRDFRTAPGAVQLRQLRQAHQVYAQRQRQIRRRLAAADKRRAHLAGRRQAELQAALEDHLLRTRLPDIPGIGASLCDDLRRHARQRGGLAALAHAHRHVSGIGPVRQAAIDAWLQQVNARMPAYLARPFPGKDAILARYAGELPALEDEVARLTAADRELTPHIAQLEAAMAPLLQVTPGVLYAVLRHPGPYPEAVAVYLSGIYPEWEPAPAWYTEALAGAGS